MTHIKATAGMGRPVNPFEDDYRTKGSLARTEWEHKNSTPLPVLDQFNKPVMDFEGEGEMADIARKPGQSNWFIIEESEKDFYSEFGCDFSKVWLVHIPTEGGKGEKDMDMEIIEAGFNCRFDLSDKSFCIKQASEGVWLSKFELIKLRDFLNQLELSRK